MTRQTLAPDLTDEEIAGRLHEAREDERQGHLVHCENEAQLRESLGSIRNQV